MANRTGTYIAFDGLGETDPSKSDFRHYSTIQMWDKARQFDFKFTNSHDKTAAVRDTSKKETLKARIRERLAASKNIVIILSPQTRKTGSMLSYEIEQAVDTYALPLIVVYTGYKVIKHYISSRWPDSLMHRLLPTKGIPANVKSIHIPFRQKPLFAAISQFTVNSMPKEVITVYTAQAYVKWGLISDPREWGNITSD